MNNKRIDIRISEYEYLRLCNIAKTYNTTVSQLIRQCIDLMINGQYVSLKDVIKEIKLR